MKQLISVWMHVVLLVAATTAIPNITPDTPDVTILENSDRSLKCTDTEEITWYFGHPDRHSIPLDLDEGLDTETGQYVSTLNLNDPLSDQHVGYYYCLRKAEAEEFPTERSLVELFQEKPDQVNRIYVYLDFKHIGLYVDHIRDLVATIGETLTVPCIATRKGVSVTLTKDGQPIDCSDRRSIELDELTVEQCQHDRGLGFRMQADTERIYSVFYCNFEWGNGQIKTLLFTAKIFDRGYTTSLERVQKDKMPDKPKISSVFGSFAEETHDIELDCRTNEDSVTLHWVLPAESTAIQDKRVVLKNSPAMSKLIVQNAKKNSDSGRYECYASSRTSLKSAQDIDIKVIDYGKCHISIVEPSGIYTVDIRRRNEKLIWAVEYNGHPTPLMAEWIDPNSELITNGSKFTITTKQHSDGRGVSKLIIDDPVLADMGIYTLRVQHDDSKCPDQNRTFTLNVHEAPIVHVPESIVTRAQHEISVLCNVIGYPASTIHWTWTECPLGEPPLDGPWSVTADGCRSRMAVEQDGLASTEVHNDRVQNSTIAFRPPGPGRLTCTAQNNQSAGVITAQSVAVYVLNREHAVVTELLPTVLMAGEPAQLQCLVHMYNYTDDVWWERDGTVVRDAGDRLQLHRDHVDLMHRVALNFTAVHVADDGLYVCMARAFNGSVSEHPHAFRVHEQQQPLFQGVAEWRASPVTRQKIERLVLSCAPEGMPTPQVQWMKDDTLVTEDDHVLLGSAALDAERLMFNHTLLVERMEYSDAGEYRCVATNANGEANYRVSVVVQTDGPSKTTIGLVVGLLVLLLLTICVGLYFYRREHKKWLLLKHAGIAYFDNGDMSSYNPDLSRMEQADLLPYDHKYEFPRDRLRLSGVKLGAGAFGVVYKAQALGIQPDVDETTVAVKTIKNTDKDEDIKALISELKIMIHMGKHVNVVNLLGAVTRDIRKRSLYVITEYCDLGNLYHFLKKNRNHFVNQVDHVSDEINPDILTIQQQVHEYGLKYITLGHMFNNNHEYSSKPYYVNDREPDGAATSMSAFFQGSAGLDSDAQLLSMDSIRGSRRTTSSYTQQNGQNSAAGYVHGNFQTVTTSDLVCWSYQVACGMSYLASRGVLHGDLAARNILLCSDKVVKICDFGLSRSLHPEQDYQKESDGKLPIKWLAIESISHMIFNTSTDVWSFGIFMWELFSMAQVPYADVPIEKMLVRLQEGHRLLRPKYATQALYDVMRECWCVEPGHRPRFDTLARRLGEILPADVRQEFIDMNDQYMQVNIDEGRGQGDYLSALLPPEASAPSVPAVRRPTTLATVEDGDQSPGAEAIPMLPQLYNADFVRGHSPLARSDTDTDLDNKEWRLQAAALPSISPRRVPPQNTYVNLPTTSPPPVPAPWHGNGDGGSGGADAISNPGYVMMNQR